MSANAVKPQVQALFNAQTPAAAVPLLRAAIKKTPKDPELWFLLGIAQGMDNNPQAAEQAFRRTVELSPQAFAAWENLGRALLQLNQTDQAEHSYRKSIALNTANPSAYAGLGELLRIKGDTAASIQALRTALNLDRQSAPLHNQIGASLAQAGTATEALQHYRTAIKLAPNFYDARFNLAQQLYATGDVSQAVPQFQACTQLNPHAIPAWFGLADSLLELNRWRESIDIYKHILSLDARAHSAHLTSARIWISQGELATAQQHLAAAIAIRPEIDPDISALRAELAILNGDFEAARTALAPAVEKFPKHLALALAEASLAERDRAPEAVIAKLEGLRDACLQPPDTLHFALGRLYERGQRYDEAFHAFHAAHARRGMSSDLQQHLDEMDRIEAFFTREHLVQLHAAHNEDATPIFIVGMPRSGTSLAEQILASHPDVYGAGESTQLWQAVRAIEKKTGQTYPDAVQSLHANDLEEYAQTYLQNMRALAPDARRICDKLPHNFLHLGLIQLLFPRATVIHCTRNPLDTCLSIFTLRFNINNRYAQNLIDLGRYYRRYQQLMAHWQRTLDLKIHTLDYERLIGDQDGETRRLLAAAGLKWDDACLRFFETGRTVVTPSYDQVRRPLYSSSVQRWQRFEAHLEPLKQALQS